MISTKKWGKWHFCDAPLNFTVFDLKLNLVFGPHVQTNWKPASFDFFEDQFWPLLYFFEPLDRSYLADKRKKEKITKAGFQFVGWCMINIVFKHHTQIRKIEQGMANPRLWQ